MELDNLIKERRSIRNFEKKEVSWKKINEILESFIYAPCAGGIQNWRLIVLKNKEQLNEACFDQEPVAKSNFLVVICSDDDEIVRNYKKDGKFFAIQNTSAGIQNMLLKAHSLEVGSCWIGAFDKNEVKAILKIPENIDIHAIIAFGYADEKPKIPLRASLGNVIYFDEWGTKKRDIFPLKK